MTLRAIKHGNKNCMRYDLNREGTPIYAIFFHILCILTVDFYMSDMSTSQFCSDLPPIRVFSRPFAVQNPRA